jgi:hypothetical protein
MEDGFDWRIAAATRIVNPIPAAYPGGPSHRGGSALFQSALVETHSGENIGFTLPSATAMAINVAINAGKEANKLKRKLVFDDVVTFNGPGRSVSNSANSMLYDFFEQCMISVAFSYQALEVFSNHTIARDQKGSMVVKRRKKRAVLAPIELERHLSTEEKLTIVLPKIKNVPTPKGKHSWQLFKKLKHARDATIHLKYRDQQAVDRDSLFFVFLNEDPESFPRAAVEIILYFNPSDAPRWLQFLSN